MENSESVPAFPPITASELASRRNALVDTMTREGAGAALLGPGASLIYFTGIHWKLSERLFACVVLPHRKPCIVCPAFEASRLAASLPEGGAFRVATWEEDESPYQVCIKTLESRPSKPVLIDPALPSGFLFQLQQASSTLPLISGQAAIHGLRRRKSPAELKILETAMGITLSVHRTIHDSLEHGVDSESLKAEIDRLHSERGADSGSTFCIVSFGAATAIPHGSPHPQRLSPGDFVLIDTGCTLHGYHADLTRTYVFGEPSARQRELWLLEREAQLAGFAAAQLGAPCSAIDDAARSVLERAGFGPGYQLPGLPHRTGHGIGLEIHESPYFVRGNTTVLEPGMCGSIEPMLSLPGEAGIRLEDHFYMSEQGAVWFTEPSKAIDAPFG